jgi:hypothetical protein
MKIERFNENIDSKDRIFIIHGKPLRQMIVNSYNTQGYKLYYYNDFKLIEILSVNGRNLHREPTWEKYWGEMIFFLNEEEYDNAMKLINKSKELYDQYIKQADTVAKLPLSYIYDILNK